MKPILAVLAALFAAFMVIFLVELISHQMYPVPVGLDLKNNKALEEWIKSLPIGAMLLVLLGWFLGAIVGAFVACKMDKENTMRRSIVFGAVLLGATLMNLFEFSHPIWMWAGGIIAIVAGAWIGYTLFDIFQRRVKIQ